MKKRTGFIYKIYCKSNRKSYIGSTVNYQERWKQHYKNLNNNDHHNQYLQNSWNKYGEKNFEFKLILCVQTETRKELYDLETSYIKNTAKSKRFNASDLAIGGSGFCATNSTYFFISPQGEFFSGENIKAFCREFKLKQSDMTQLNLGNLKSACGGWTTTMWNHCIYRFYGSFLYERNGQTTPIYYLQDPSGKIHKVYNLKKFCKENNLNTSKINATVTGIRPHHKNWKAWRS